MLEERKQKEIEEIKTRAALERERRSKSRQMARQKIEESKSKLKEQSQNYRKSHLE